MTCHGCCSWGCHLNHRIMHRPQHTHKARFGWYKYISKTTIKILYNVIYNTRFTRCKNLYNLTNRKYFCVKCDYVNQLSWIITFLDYNDKIIRQQKLIQSKYFIHLAKMLSQIFWSIFHRRHADFHLATHSSSSWSQPLSSIGNNLLP